MGLESPTPANTGTSGFAVSDPGRQDDAPIGAPLEEARLRLLGLIDRLSGPLGEHAAPLLDAARKQLEQRACRIAVVGQIKAGKSTFINALAGLPGFLPTDINPWTAVVTSLHFRRSPDPPEHAAVFHLFSLDQWTELADGGGRLRELTERLVPGFQPDLLRAQLEVMRRRAEQRLGAQFGALLGQCHRHKSITPQLLADYVSAGDDQARATAKGARKHYSDITRSADLYFNTGPFAYPITLVDTPGTNDPFLVRDEITRRSLESPDIYVFVVSALQPLSAADIAMLRLLNGLHKDRIVVFINRADQLPNPGADAAAIKAAVEKRLRLEFPALEIPVIAGSAWMGNLRLQTGYRDQDAAPPPAGLPRRSGLLAKIDATSSRLSNIDRSRFHAPTSSGMREVSAAVTKLMGSSSIAMLLRQIAVCLGELSRSADVTSRAELESIQDLLDLRRRESNALRASIAREQQALAAFEERANALQACLQGIEAHFNDLTRSASQILHYRLCTLVRTFADEQAEVMLQALETDPSQKAWHCDVLPLRERLLAAYVACFEQSAADLARIEEFLYPHLKVIVASLLPTYRGSLLEVPAWPAASAPPVAPLAGKVTMDLGMPWWREWFAAPRSAEERADDLRRLIEADFLRIAEELVREAEQRLAERVDYVMQRVNAISAGLRIGLERRHANLAREHALLDGTGDELSLQRFESEQNRRAEECSLKLEVYAAAQQDLGSVLEILDAAQTRAR
jgi:signal recognition particle receptor subunit beta